jgi:hypothetical protein
MPGNMPGTLPMPVRRVRNRSRQNVVCQVSDKLIYGLQLFPARRASGNDDSGRTNPVLECSQSVLLNFLLKIREKFFPRHGSSEEERGNTLTQRAAGFAALLRLKMCLEAR